jgi:2-C-methyl-D-erythritol 4-phosphate cytidylyltransferase
LIACVCRAALRDGAAIAALPASDTVKLARLQEGKIEKGGGAQAVVEQTLDRGTIWLAQTPQVFRREILCEALARAEADGFIGTDCASLVERLSGPDRQPLQRVTIVEGEARNFKITFAADLERAAALIDADSL